MSVQFAQKEWRTVALREVASVLRGVSYDKGDASSVARAGHIPLLRAGNIGETVNVRDDLVWVPEKCVSDKQRLRCGDIVMCASSGSADVVGKSALLPTEWLGSFGAFCVALRAEQSMCLPEFLAFFLRSRAFRDWAKKSQGINIKNIRKSELECFTVPLPPLDDQRRIVDILNHAASIRRLREESRVKTLEVATALFSKFFGISPYQDWPVLPFGELVRETQLGIVRGAREMDEGHPFPYVRMDSICSGGSLRLTGLKRVQASKEEVERYSLRKGDFLFNTRNSKELVGKVAFYDGDGCFLFNNNIMAVRFRQPVLPRYMVALFQTSALQAHLEPRKSGTTTVFAIYYKNLATLPVPVPPLHLQKEFADRVDELEGIADLNDRATTTAEQAAQSLLAQVFG